MTPIIFIRARNKKMKSCRLLLRSCHVYGAEDNLLAATTLCQLAARKNNVAFSYLSNAPPSMIKSLNVGRREVIYHPITRRFFSSAIKTSDIPLEPGKRGRRVWKAQQENMGEGRDECDAYGAKGKSRVKNDFWDASVDDAPDCRESLSRICAQVCVL